MSMTTAQPQGGDARNTIGFLDRPDLNSVLAATSLLFLICVSAASAAAAPASFAWVPMFWYPSAARSSATICRPSASWTSSVAMICCDADVFAARLIFVTLAAIALYRGIELPANRFLRRRFGGRVASPVTEASVPASS